MHHDQNLIQLGRGMAWGGYEYPFGLSQEDRRQHLYVIGKSGTGKTTLLRNILVQDIEAGRGVALLDPHGDLAEELLDLIPARRTEDVVYFAPADREFPIGLNLLNHSQHEHRYLIASGLVSAFKNVWKDSWGPRLEYILYAAVAALLDCENVTLLSLQRMLSDERYRAWVVKQVKDPLVRSFWTTEFANYDERYLREAIAPIQNKVGQLIMSPIIRNIIGQVRSKIDARFMMDNQRIFIANLSKGRIGEDKSSLLGSMLVTQFQLAAMSRAAIPEKDRSDFHLVVDEFHTYATDSFASILSEARKYRLCLTLSHQFTSQLRPEIRDAVFGNIGSIISFRTGHDDAKLLEHEFGNSYPARHLIELPNHEVCARLMIQGRQREPFTAKTFSPLGTRHLRGDIIIRRSREKYGSRQCAVEQKIARWLA